MTNIGETLRTARKEKELSLDDVVSATRIRAHFIEALEENNFDALGGDVYLRGFLRNYANFLGLNAESLLSQLGPLEDPLPVREPSEPRYLADPLELSPWPIGQIFRTVLLIALLMMAFVWWWWRPPLLTTLLEPVELALQSFNSTLIPSANEEEAVPTSFVIDESPTLTPFVAENTETATPINTKTALSSPTVEEEATETEEEATPIVLEEEATLPPTESPEPTAPPEPTLTTEPTSTREATATPEATSTPEPTATPESTEDLSSEGVVITAEILADTWVRVSLDDESDGAVQQTVRAGESYEWIGVESVSLRAGNAAALSLTVNGQQIGVLGASGEVIQRRWERSPDGGAPIVVGQ